MKPPPESALSKNGCQRRHPVDQDVLGSVDQRFGLARDVRVQGLDFLCLRLLDGRLTRRWLRLLRDGRRRGSRRQGDHSEKLPHTNRTHRSPTSDAALPSRYERMVATQVTVIRTRILARLRDTGQVTRRFVSLKRGEEHGVQTDSPPARVAQFTSILCRKCKSCRQASGPAWHPTGRSFGSGSQTPELCALESGLR